jgi:Flp pilus assembly protein TadD
VDRIASTRALLEGRYRDRQQGKQGMDEYRQAVMGIVLATARLDLAGGRFGPATRGAEKYIAAHPRSAAATAVLADAARQQGDGAHALELFRRAVALDPSCAEAQRGLGRALAARGERAGARAALQAYLRLSPRAVDRAWIEGELVEIDRRNP